MEILKARTALITGAASRIGRAISTALAHEGVNILIHYNRSLDDAEALARAVRNLSVQAWTLQADFSDPTQIEGLWGLVEKNVPRGKIDILINNASIFPSDRLTDFSPGNLTQNINVNALVPALLSRVFAAQVQGDTSSPQGAIVNLLDCRMADYDKDHVTYHLSKRMLFDLTRMMALEFAPKVRVNAVAPGLILTASGEDETCREKPAGKNPLKRWGGLEDITRAVLFLLKSDFITGQVIYVDGGRFLKGCLYG